jgi:hypothetical protein
MAANTALRYGIGPWYLVPGRSTGGRPARRNGKMRCQLDGLDEDGPLAGQGVSGARRHVIRLDNEYVAVDLAVRQVVVQLSERTFGWSWTATHLTT